MFSPLCSDADIALILRMSPEWVRKQRMWRRAGLPHVLTVDPILIGTSPRYILADIEAWLEAQRRPTSTGKPTRRASEPIHAVMSQEAPASDSDRNFEEKNGKQACNLTDNIFADERNYR